jgi:hypothetical protein
MGAAALTSNIHHLILYEPGLGLAYPTGSIQGIEDALAAGDREAAIFIASGALDLTEDERDAFQDEPAAVAAIIRQFTAGPSPTWPSGE